MHHREKLAAIRRDFPSDFIGAPGRPTDAWGCEFVNIGAGAIGEVKNPQIRDDDWEDAENVHIPLEWLSVDVEKVNAFCRENRDKFIFGGCCPRPFEQLQFLRGTAELYMDLTDPCEGMRRFMGKMHPFCCEPMELWTRTDVDALTK